MFIFGFTELLRLKDLMLLAPNPERIASLSPALDRRGKRGGGSTLGKRRRMLLNSERVVSLVGTGCQTAGWTGGFFSEWSEITLIPETLNIGFPDFSEVKRVFATPAPRAFASVHRQCLRCPAARRQIG